MGKLQNKEGNKHSIKGKKFKKPWKTELNTQQVNKSKHPKQRRKLAEKTFKNFRDLNKTATTRTVKRFEPNTNKKTDGASKANDKDRVPVSEELMKKYSRGEGIKGVGIKTHLEKVKILKSDKVVEWATEQAARSTVLLTEGSG